MIAALVSLLGGWRATAFALLAVFAGAFGLFRTWQLEHTRAELSDAKADIAQQAAAAEAAARVIEQKISAATAAAAANYEKGKSDAQAAADGVVAALRADNLRLRQAWRCPAAASVPAAPVAAGGVDAATDDRSESAGRIVRAAAECDAQVRALQDLVLADRAGAP